MVSEHQKRAVALWMVLIVGIVAYASWLFVAASNKRDNPSTSLVLSNDVYAYPDTWLCLYNDFGCDAQDLEEECLDTSVMTEGGQSSAIFYPGGEFEQNVSAVGKQTEDNGWCIEFKTSDVDVFLGEERQASNYLDYFLLDAYWYPGGSAGASTTCVSDGETWKPHKEWVYIFLHDPETGVTSTGIQMSYSCITSASDSHVFTYMGIGLTEQRKLGNKHAGLYRALSVTSSIEKDEVKANITHPYAHLAFQLQQEPNSYQIVTEIDPFDIAEMLGNIGGFWDLILILWPIFFVAATRQEPHLKPRDFKKPAAILAGKPSLAGVTASLPRPLKRRMSTGGQTGRTIDIAEHQIERPYWEPPSPVIEVPAPRPLRGFWGWRRRPWVVSSPKLAPSCDTHC